MTGYGKAETNINDTKYIVEIRSLNGKNCDITLKTQLIPRDKEIEVRQHLAKLLVRGNIDIFCHKESTTNSTVRTFNNEAVVAYYNQLSKIAEECGLDQNSNMELFTKCTSLPDVFDVDKYEVEDEQWDAFFATIKEAANALTEFRQKEGAILHQEVVSRVEKICNLIPEVEKFEGERITTVKDRIYSKLKDLPVSVNEERLEQEIIFYIEKLDVTEEKVRLRQHCNFFIETITKEPNPGKKLGFITQEMGREINTLGSKANHTEIQKIVVMMKDELEKIKEQSLNIL